MKRVIGWLLAGTVAAGLGAVPAGASTPPQPELLFDQLRGAVVSSGADENESGRVAGTAAITYVLGLASSGYTVEQIVEAFVTGSTSVASAGFDDASRTSCLGLLDPRTQQWVTPARASEVPRCWAEPDLIRDDGDAVSGAAETTSTIVSGAARYVLDTDDSDLFTEGLVVELTIAPDGSVSGVYRADEPDGEYTTGEINIIPCDMFEFGDDDEPLDCPEDESVTCPARYLTVGDASGLEFVGTPPTDGKISGTLTLTSTITASCAPDAVPETFTLDVAGNVTERSIDLSAPFALQLDRAE